MYKDSCCAQVTMQSVNAFSRETLAASPSCQAGRNKVYQKKEKRKLLDIFSFFLFLCSFERREDKDHTRTGNAFQYVPITAFWWWWSDVYIGHHMFSETTAVKPHNDNY